MTRVTRLVPFRYPSGHRAVVMLRYDNSDPLAVILDFGMDVNGHDVQWTVARDILADGLTHRAGEGDVRCWTDSHWFYLWLSGVDQATNLPRAGTMRLDVDEVRQFLVDAEDLMPYGAEAAGVNVELSRLLIGGW